MVRALSCRIVKGLSRFPATLTYLRAQFGAPPVDTSWLEDAPLAALRRLERLFEEDELLLQLYIRSAEADCADDATGGYYRARCALEVLAGPDERMASTFALAPHLLGPRKIISRALWTGLLPFGQWAALASSTEHVPRMTPETQDVLALFKGSPTWRGLTSLLDLRAVLATKHAPKSGCRRPAGRYPVPARSGVAPR